jgi:hypothetical protein
MREKKWTNVRMIAGAERVTITCPACRLQCQVANMIDQRFVLEKMAVDQAGSTGHCFTYTSLLSIMPIQ